MSETTKTALFATVALVSLVAAFATGPGSTEVDAESRVGQTIGDFNPSDAKRLKIVRFDEETATLREFEVAQVDGLWTIPSKNGYPADAQRQMGQATTSVLDREILTVASNSAAHHEEYGVVDPLSPKLEVGQKSVGTRVILSDANDRPLVDWIIGKEVKDRPEQRYIREAGRDLVYTIDIDPNQLSTNFSDWIEGDLLEFNPLDIEQIEIKDYSANLIDAGGGRLGIDLDQRSDLTLRYDDEEAKWTAEKLQSFDSNSRKFLDFQLAAGQQLNDENLTELKNALDDLRIVDVARKPAGLSADLRAGDDFLNNITAFQDLAVRGFAAPQTAEGKRDILSSAGELIATMKDGVEYVLRFGELQLSTGSPNEPSDSSDAAAADAKKSEGLNRYMFVMARFNEDAVAKPKLDELPPLPEKAPETTEETQDEATDDAETASEDSAGESAEEPAAESDQSSEDDDTARIIALRKAIEQENERKLNEYQATLKRGRQRVNDLNTRFGDWYYIVSNDVYKKVRLGRDDVVMKNDSTGSAVQQDENASAAGAPGTAIPGLPEIPGATQ